jgi:transglutaminase-like putative cysteine protease
MGINDNFRYLNIGLPEDVARRKAYGDFEGALAAIDRRLRRADTPEAMRRCLTAQRELICRLPADYPLTRGDALALARKSIPDFSEEEFDALVDDCRIDWIYVRGVPHYFNRFFDSLCKTDAAIARRAGVRPIGADGHDSSGMLADTLRRMRERGSVSLRIRCRASVELKAEDFRAGGRVRAYLPLPCACDGQSDIRIEAVSPAPTRVSPETAPQRVVFWEEQLTENHPFTVEFSYTRTARYTDLSHPLPGGVSPTFDTEELPPHAVFTPYLWELARTLTEGVEEPLEKARRFYDFITQNVKYAYSRAYFCLENIPDACARNLTGDCGMMALLFITLCRCAGIPARWESGWKAEPGFCGAHDWARFYAAPYGWLYADPSFGCGAAREGDEARRQHYFGNLDPFRMAANTQFQADFDVPKDHWRADPYDNQVGEMETESRGLRYDEFLRGKEVLDCTEL